MTLGILGGGQLGRMTALAAIRVGVSVRCLAPTDDGPMRGLGELIVGDWEDPAVLRRFAEGCTAVTAESEWVPADAMAAVLPEGVALWPHPETLRLIRDKGLQKRTLAAAGLDVPPFELPATPEALVAAGERLGWPMVVKQRRGSYDGYGNAVARSPVDVPTAWERLADDDGVLVEAFAPFVRELSVLVARRADGQHVEYPVVHAEQRDARCHAVTVPAPVTAAVRERASRTAHAAIEAVRGVGLLAVELFELEDGTVWVNELAPRPHNTGHYTIEACHTSQFENHVRAVLGLPLGDAGLRVPAAAMVNVLGQGEGPAQVEGLPDALAVPDAAVHLYGKADSRPKRKMGHVTVTADTPASARASAERAAAAIRI